MFSSILLLALFAIISIATSFPLNSISLFKRVTDLTLKTQNDLVNGTPCKPLTIIFGRGSVSPGNVGSNTGPSFFQAVADIIGITNLAVQGVDYPADIFGFLAGGSESGTKKMMELVELAFKQCPETKVALSGYSQGAQLLHKSAKMLSPATTAKISTVVMFGDPLNGTAVTNIPASKVATFCHDGDNICEGGILVLPTHWSYSPEASAAAAFVVKQSGLSV